MKGEGGRAITSHSLDVIGSWAILRTYLHPLLLQINLHGKLFAQHHIGIMRFVEGGLQLLELLLGEDGAMAALSFWRWTMAKMMMAASHMMMMMVVVGMMAM